MKMIEERIVSYQKAIHTLKEAQNYAKNTDQLKGTVTCRKFCEMEVDFLKQVLEELNANWTTR